MFSAVRYLGKFSQLFLLIYCSRSLSWHATSGDCTWLLISITYEIHHLWFWDLWSSPKISSISSTLAQQPKPISSPWQEELSSIFTVRSCLVHTAKLPFSLLAADRQGNRMKLWHFSQEVTLSLTGERDSEGSGISREAWICGSDVKRSGKNERCKYPLQVSRAARASVASVAPADFRWTVGPSLLRYPKQMPYLYSLPRTLGGTWDSDM